MRASRAVTSTLTEGTTTVGTAWVGADGVFSTTLNLQAEGLNAITASVTDSYGNVGTSPADVVDINTLAPTVSIISAPEASYATSTVITGKISTTGLAPATGDTLSFTDNGSAIAASLVTINVGGTYSATVARHRRLGAGCLWQYRQQRRRSGHA